MPKPGCLAMVVVVAGLAATQAKSDEKIDCDRPKAPQERVYCAERAYEAQDKRLNAAYRAARVRMGAIMKKEGFPKQIDPRPALRDAQRAWIKYRDANCGLQGALAFGGTSMGLRTTQCLERATRVRAAVLEATLEELKTWN